MLEEKLRLVLNDSHDYAFRKSMNDKEIFFLYSQTSNMPNGTLKDVARYMIPFCDEFINTSNVVDVKAEVWQKNDLASPGHIYLRKDSKYPFKLQVTCTQVPVRMVGEIRVLAGQIGSKIDLSVPIGTKQCITAFRCDLTNLITSRCHQLSGFTPNEYFVEVYFKKSQNNTEETPKMFEERVAQCVSNGKTLELQFALRTRSKPIKPSISLKAHITPVKPSISSNVSPKEDIHVKEASKANKSDDKKDEIRSLAHQAIRLDVLREDFKIGKGTAQPREAARLMSTLGSPPFTGASAAEKGMNSGGTFLPWKKKIVVTENAEKDKEENAKEAERMQNAAKEARNKCQSYIYPAYQISCSCSLGPPLSLLWPSASTQTANQEAWKPNYLQHYPHYLSPWFFADYPSSLYPKASGQTKAAKVSTETEDAKSSEHANKSKQEDASQKLPLATSQQPPVLQRKLAGSVQDTPGSEAKEQRKKRCNPSLVSSIECQAPSSMPSSRAGAKDQGQEDGLVKDTSIHNATCNLCDKRIVGIRWKCTACIDFDVCSACKDNTASTHPFHQWMKLQSTDALPLGVQPSDWVIHPNIRCNSCDKAIVGPRYKCIRCPNFDWCNSCESNPALHHGIPEEEPHIFLKINKPLPDTRSVELAKVQAKATVNAMNKCNSAHAEEAIDTTLEMPDVFNKELAEQQEANLDKYMQAIVRFEKKQRKTEKRVDSFGDEFKNLNDAIEKIFNEIDEIHTVLSNTHTNAFGDKSKGFELENPDSTADIVGKTDQKHENLLCTTKITPATKNLCKEGVDSLHARLAHLSPKAQKLPGASLVANGLVNVEEEYKVADAHLTEEDSQSVAEDYDMQVEADITVPDGARFATGSLFDKVWRVPNRGAKARPEDTYITSLTDLTDPTQTVKHSVKIGRKIEPGEVTRICVPNLVAHPEAGRDVYFFRLALPSEFGKILRFFGDQLWYDIEIVDDTSSNETSKAKNSIATSMHHAEPLSSDSKEQESGNDMIESFSQAQLALHLAQQNDCAPSSTDLRTSVFSSTPTTKKFSDIEDLILLGSDEDFEIIEPSSDEESD